MDFVCVWQFGISWRSFLLPSERNHPGPLSSLTHRLTWYCSQRWKKVSLDSAVLLCRTKPVLAQKSIDKVDGDDGVGGSSTASLLCCIMDLLPRLWPLFMHYLAFIVRLCQWMTDMCVIVLLWLCFTLKMDQEHEGQHSSTSTSSF